MQQEEQTPVLLGWLKNKERDVNDTSDDVGKHRRERQALKVFLIQGSATWSARYALLGRLLTPRH